MGGNGTIRRRQHTSDKTMTHDLHDLGVWTPGGYPHGIYGSMNRVDVPTAPGYPTETHQDTMEIVMRVRLGFNRPSAGVQRKYHKVRTTCVHDRAQSTPTTWYDSSNEHAVPAHMDRKQCLH